MIYLLIAALGAFTLLAFIGFWLRINILEERVAGLTAIKRLELLQGGLNEDVHG